MDHLRGVRVLDLTRLTPGGFATLQLAELGAEVIKVEEPGRGDYMRDLAPAGFEILNRNKRSVAIDLKHPQGKATLRRLAERADVFLEGFRPGVIDRLGFGYDELSRSAPRLVYCSLSGYGQSGPLREASGHEINYQGVSGMARLLARSDGTMEPSVVSIGDFLTAGFVALSVTAALLRRGHTGTGDYVDIAIADVLTSVGNRYLAEYRDRPNVAPAAVAERGGYGMFTAADGHLLALGCTEDAFWHRLVDTLGPTSPLHRFRDRSSPGADPHLINHVIATEIAGKDAAFWLELGRSADIPISPVHRLDRVAEDEQLASRLLFRPGRCAGDHVRFPALFASGESPKATAAPSLGQHTDQVLLDHDFVADEIAALRVCGAVS